MILANTVSTSSNDTAHAGIVNLGTIQGTTGSIEVDSVGGHGIYSNAGKFDLASIKVTNAGLNTAMIGIYLDGGSNMKATTISVNNTGKQGIQLQHVNTLTANTVTIENTVKNGLRLYNKNGNPTVTIGTLKTINCDQCGVAADQQEITDANLNISAMWYKNCGTVLHANIKSGVATPQEITEQ